MKKTTGVAKMSAYLLFFIAILTFGFERLFWVNANSYPDFMATTHMTKLTKDEYIAMRQSCGQPLEVNVYNSYIAIRCGLYWPFNKVVLVDSKGIPWFGKNGNPS